MMAAQLQTLPWSRCHDLDRHFATSSRLRAPLGSQTPCVADQKVCLLPPPVSHAEFTKRHNPLSSATCLRLSYHH